jgi:hypothetical protein
VSGYTRCCYLCGRLTDGQKRVKGSPEKTSKERIQRDL